MAPKLPSNRGRLAGFTLIELLVSIGLFAVVVVIVSGAISSVISANKKAQTLTSVVNNLNFTLESMTRAIKTGSALAVSGGTTGTCGSTVSLVDARNRPVSYSRVGSAIALTVDGAVSPITAPEIRVDDLQFCDLVGDQPAVLFVVAGTMELSGGSASSTFRVQTTVEQRALQLGS